MRYAAADFDRLRQPGTRDRPGSLRVGQAERYVNGLASPGGDLEPKWRDYLRRFVTLVRGRREPAYPQWNDGDAAVPEVAPAGDRRTWTERAREFAPHMLPLARQLDQLDAALAPGAKNDAFRRLFHGGRLELTQRFHEEATKALRTAVHNGEQQVAQHIFDRRAPTGPAPAPPRPATLPSLIAQAANVDAERRRAERQPVSPAERPRPVRSASAPAPRGRRRG